jgi:hypothetical protein
MPHPRAPRLVLVALAIIFFAPLLLQPGALIYPASGFGSDLITTHWPEFGDFTRALRQGYVPLWSGSVLLGRPFAGDVGTLWMYPPGLLALIAPPALAFNLLSLLHVALAGILAHLYLRLGLRLSDPAALAGALVFMFWPRFMAHVAGGHVGLTGAAALLPLMLLGAQWAFVEGRWFGAALIALSLYGQLTGLVQNFIYGVWVVIAYALAAAVWRASRERRRARAVAQPLGALALAGALTAGLAAVVLLPALELLPYTTRQGLTLEAAGGFSLPPAVLLNLALPFRQQFPEWLMYIGALPLALALLALCGARRRWALAMWALVAVCAVYALGPAGGLFSLAFNLLPGFNLLRAAPRLWLLAGMALSVAVALGAETLAQSMATPPALRRILAGLALLWLIGLGSTFILPVVDSVVVVSELVALAALGAVGWARDRGRLSATHAQASGLAVLAASLLMINWRFLSSLQPAETFLRPFPPFAVADPERGRERWYAETPRFQYALAAERGIETVQGVQSFQLAHSVELVSLASGCRLRGYAAAVPPCLSGELAGATIRTTDPSARLLGVLNARWLLRAEPPEGAEWRPVPGFADLYENTRWLPRAFVVGEARQVVETDVLAQLPTIDPATTALLSEPLPEPLRTPAASGPVDSFHPANPQSLTISLDRTAPGLLVVSIAWAPGWQARLDGDPAPVYRVNHALLGVYVPAGEHTVHLEYSPRGWQWGWPISLLTLCGLGVWSVMARRARR